MVVLSSSLVRVPLGLFDRLEPLALDVLEGSSSVTVIVADSSSDGEVSSSWFSSELPSSDVCSGDSSSVGDSLGDSVGVGVSSACGSSAGCSFDSSDGELSVEMHESSILLSVYGKLDYIPDSSCLLNKPYSIRCKSFNPSSEGGHGHAAEIDESVSNVASSCECRMIATE